MKNTMKYKGYIGSVHYSDDDRVFYGQIEFIRDLVSYEGTDVDGLYKAFTEAVDDYLELCHETGKEADQTFKGSFNVRTGSDLHRKVAQAAKEQGVYLNDIVVKALEDYLQR